MYIGEVAKKTGLSVKAIRYYERRGLIVTPQRQGRYRIYKESDVEILNLIKEAKLLGVTLAQLKGVIIYQNDNVDWDRIDIFLIEIKQRLLDQIEDLKTKVKKVDECHKLINS